MRIATRGISLFLLPWTFQQKIAHPPICATRLTHFFVTSDSELAVKYCFHLPLPKASQCFILDWLHYKRISVKHFVVTPW